MTRNFKLIGGFGIAEKELSKRQKSVQELIDKYYGVGIREFFVGYNPPYWHETFGFEFSPNGRFGENEQITSFETLKLSVDHIHSLGSTEVYLTMNFRYYSDETFPYITRIIDEAISVGVDGFIVGAPEILEYLGTIGYTGKIHISTILSLYNEDAIGFIIDQCDTLGLNLNRIILPREVTLLEIKRLCELYPHNNFEVFGHGDYCRYANGLCLAEHKYFSRDLCGYVLKQGLEIKKTVRYDRKEIITDPTLNDREKQAAIDNRLTEKESFVSQYVVETNGVNRSLDDLLLSLDEYDHRTIYSTLKRDINTNFFKYIYDGLRPRNDPHNAHILKTLSLWSRLEVEKESEMEEKIEKIRRIAHDAQEMFEKSKKEKGSFGVESYYKFLLYNRTSVPFYQFFNSIPNIKVVKIPQRGRDVALTMLNLEMIDQAIENPAPFVDIANLSSKYFHYDPSKLDFFQETLHRA